MQEHSLLALNNKVVELGIPIKGMFELTARCNLRCKFCYVCDRTTDTTTMAEKTTNEWLHMIREATYEGMLVCTFTGGEPFLREDFEEIYCKAFDMGLRITIFTNAILIGSKQLAYLKKRLPDHISISLYGASENSYQELCSYGEGYHRAITSIDALHAAEIPITLKTLALRPLLGEFEAMGNVAAKYQCKAGIDIYLGPVRDEPQSLINQWRIPLDQIAEAKSAFQNGARIPKEPYHIPPSITTQMQQHIPTCRSGKSGFFITHDGKMLGCPTLSCYKTYPFKTGFRVAWTGLKELIYGTEVCEDCTNCPYIYSCQPCAANRLQETGSVARCNDYLKALARSFSLYQQEDVI